MTATAAAAAESIGVADTPAAPRPDAQAVTVLTALVVVQLAWIAALGYGVYWFVS